MATDLFRKKLIGEALGHNELKRTMGRTALLFFSVGSIVGSGIVVIVAGLDPATWLVFALWMSVGQAIYFAYSRRKSRLRGEAPPA